MSTTTSTYAPARATDARVRRLAKRKGYRLAKSRSRDTAGLYVLLDDYPLGQVHDPASAFKRGEGETLDRIEARLTPIKAFRPYAGKPTDEQLRCGPLPYVSARTGTAFRKPVLIVYRSLASEALEYCRPVEDFLNRHRHEIVAGPARVSDKDDPDMLGPSEFTMYRLLDYDEAV
ncbi:Uncharacterised protein [Mycobacteroides abscessus subsp. abscessus]|uniref:hypothetical protein n=1 Tax=Mycobacteroides abscessus TaxID=36809 RepID=UPI000927105E|nr:hypothetical protein [Mycobacteroides abscessus]MDO3064098.1 hypothetical protein [Mycobacteroides abscessus subsp. abscessus]SID20157.1 Uncharacterised protein [Mycobacteroides abscessus subsp. abscessus]SKQ43857.1 Uncharacterised protein [Mycobacteroides abscessus subsp. abscessus]